jgi:hypothetical protein
MLHAHVGFIEFLTTACYVIIFATMWRVVMYALRRNDHPDAAGAMAFIF